jgi:hypothetical protein
MADIPEVENKDGGPMQTWIGLCVVILATFLGIANVKDDNIVQAMQLKQAERIDNWSWYQARKIRASVYEAFAEELSVPRPNESPEMTRQREDKIGHFRQLAKDQISEADKQRKTAENAEEDYKALNAKDDQFDLCEAALAIGLALMGVTALVKRKWLFVVALIPSVFGLLMGIAGFLGMDTNSPVISWIVQVLS